jgi:hypothetical protein
LLNSLHLSFHKDLSKNQCKGKPLAGDK